MIRSEALKQTAIERIGELRQKIQQDDYIRQAIHEIALLLTNGLEQGDWTLHERKTSRL